MHFQTSYLFKHTFFANFSLREGIASNVANWENCTMYIQDIISPGLNIAAEISKEEAYKFKNMCKLFSSDTSHKQVVDEYFLTQAKRQSPKKTEPKPRSPSPVAPKTSVNETPSVSNTKSTVHKLSAESLFSLENLKAAIASIECLNDGASSSARVSTTILKPATVQKLEHLIKVDQVSMSIKTEMDHIMLRSKDRIKNEAHIINLLSCILKAHDATVEVRPFGSVTYGFGGQRTNFNIFIMTGEH